MRKIVQVTAYFDSGDGCFDRPSSYQPHGRLIALCEDGSMWRKVDMDNEDWQRVSSIGPEMQDDDIDLNIPPVPTSSWFPNGWPIWCVDLNDDSVVQVPNADVFARWHKYQANAHAPWTLIEAGDEKTALQIAKAPGSVGREVVTIDGEQYEVLSDTIPF